MKVRKKFYIHLLQFLCPIFQLWNNINTAEMWKGRQRGRVVESTMIAINLNLKSKNLKSTRSEFEIYSPSTVVLLEKT